MFDIKVILNHHFLLLKTLVFLLATLISKMIYFIKSFYYICFQIINYKCVLLQAQKKNLA